MRPSASKLNLRAIRRSLTGRFWCDDQLSADLVDAIWRGDLERLLYASTPLQEKDRCIVVRYDHPAGPLLIKRHVWGGAGRTFRSVGRESSARRCGRLGLELHRAGIPTPLPRACLEHRLGPWGTRSYLVTDYVEGPSLYRYIRFGSQSASELRHVAQQVAHIWQRLVEAGISHNDMKPENFIVDERLDVWLLDLEKVRLHEKPSRQRKRCTFDVKNFLHVRGWHRRAEAREIFYREFLNTPYGSWLDGVLVPEEPDPELSVLVLTDRHPNVASIRRAIDSVRDIADEVVPIAAAGDGGVDVLDRVVLSGDDAGERAATAPLQRVARYPWVLVLRQNEIVTPFLAKQLQQQIADANAQNAIRIPIVPQFFGRSILPTTGDNGRPIRLFRQEHCLFSWNGGDFAIAAVPEQMGRLTGTIQRCVCESVAEFVERLNEQSTRAAHQRWQAGERPAMLRALVRAIARGLKLAAGRGGIGSGWTGLQIAFLEGAFSWVEEAKLRQMTHEFFVEATSDAAPSESGADCNVLLSSPSWDEAALRKAA
ncbi:MAG: hypothetical protein L0228_09815 [Planctomycetes bacterium]|nr:hypothetical protein [Planctomycetota bacterium]